MVYAVSLKGQLEGMFFLDMEKLRVADHRIYSYLVESIECFCRESSVMSKMLSQDLKIHHIGMSFEMACSDAFDKTYPDIPCEVGGGVVIDVQ